MVVNGARKQKGISRIDAGSTHGWFLRVYHRGEVYRKFFGDRIFDGEELALQAAIAHRDAYVREQKIEYLPFFTSPMKSNTTGVHGVSETFQRARSGEKIPCFNVFWAPEPGARRCKRFYFHHYANREEALQAAAKFRKEKEREIITCINAGNNE